MSSNPIVMASNLAKSYHDGELMVDVLKDVNFAAAHGECIAVVGPSGSGKSTLLHLLGGLDEPSDGSVFINGIAWQSLAEKKRCQARNRHFGFIYQFHHLLTEFSALENVAMPLLLAKQPRDKATKDAGTMLEHVGLASRVNHKPAQLSGGERQRVAIARALVHRPQCVFADEPTGNLDQSTAMKVFDLMLMLNSQFNTAFIIVTHDLQLAQRMDKVLLLTDGKLDGVE